MSNSTLVFVTASDFDALVLLLWATIVFFLQAGFAMLEAGAVERALTINILFKNAVDASVIALTFWAVGYGLAFGQPANAFSGLGEFFLIGTPASQLPYFFFQYSFSTTTATILSGGAAGRLRIPGYMLYCVMMGSILHPLVIHWIWSNVGWLSATSPSALFGVGMLDFAGGVAVHVNGGAATLAALVVGGYRNEMSNDPSNPPRFEPAGNGKWKSNVLPASRVTDSTYGIFVLWFGFFAFNMGSFVTFTGKADLVGLVGINTALSTAAASLGSIGASQLIKLLEGRRASQSSFWQIDDVLNGTLIGLVAATSHCALVRPWAAVVIGAVAGVCYQGSVRLMERLRLDDPVQAVPVHFVGGFVSVIGAALFAEPGNMQRVYGLSAPPSSYGLLLGGGGLHLATAVIGFLSVTAFSWVCTYCSLGLMYLVDKRFKFRYFFMRSSYEMERVKFFDFESEGSLTPLGIAEVTGRTLKPDAPGSDQLFMFANPPREDEEEEGRKFRKIRKTRTKKRWWNSRGDPIDAPVVPVSSDVAPFVARPNDDNIPVAVAVVSDVPLSFSPASSNDNNVPYDGKAIRDDFEMNVFNV